MSSGPRRERRSHTGGSDFTQLITHNILFAKYTSGYFELFVFIFHFLFFSTLTNFFFFQVFPLPPSSTWPVNLDFIITMGDKTKAPARKKRVSLISLYLWNYSSNFKNFKSLTRCLNGQHKNIKNNILPMCSF